MGHAARTWSLTRSNWKFSQWTFGVHVLLHSVHVDVPIPVELSLYINVLQQFICIKKNNGMFVNWFRYTLLIGRPPFETSSLKDTYTKIRKGEYVIPATKVSSDARKLISHMLQIDPSLRPTPQQILLSDFLTKCKSALSTFNNSYLLII